MKALLLSFFLSLSSFAQTTLKGNITSINGEAIPYGNILLRPIDSKSIVAYATSNEKGEYLFKTSKKGRYFLIFTSLGYKEKSLLIELNEEVLEIIHNVILEVHIQKLDEVIVQTKKQIQVKKDTIVFDAKSFSQGNEQTVEDLLKKIPNLNISEDGTIKVGNQEIEKVMIDGDDFFEKGYKLVTKNMPASPVDKIEVYQDYSNNKHLKNIEKSEKVALNLTLKEDTKHVWFGNSNTGYGLTSENRYEVSGNLMNFGKRNKHYFLANLNNIGEDAVGDINHLIRPFRQDEPTSIGDNQSATTLLSLNYELPNLKKRRVNLNNAEMASLNSIFTLSDKLKLKLLGFLNTDEIVFSRNRFQSFSSEGVTFDNTEDFLGRKVQITGFGKIDLIYDVTKTKTIEYTGKFNVTNEKNNSNLLFNSNLLKERLTSNNQLFDQKLVFTNKFKDNNVFLVSGRYINEKSPQNYNVNQFIFNDLFSENADNIQQYSENEMQFLGVETHLLNKKKNGDLLEIKIGNQLRIDNLKTRFELLENENSIAFPLEYQNNVTFVSNDMYASTKYRFKFDKINLLAQSDFHQLFNQLENANSKVNQTPFFIIPKIGLEYTINDKNKIVTSYSYNTTNAGVLDVYPGFVQTNFRSFSKGLEAFKQLNASNAIVNYTYGSWGDKLFANTFIMYSNNYDFFSTNSFIAKNYSQSEKIVIKDRELLSMVSNIERYFKTIKSNFKLTSGASKTNFKNIVNNSNFREVKNINVNYGLEVRSGFSGFFNFHFGSKWNYNQVKTTINNSFTDNNSFLDVSFIVSDKFNMQLQSEQYFFGNLDKGNNKYNFLDLEAQYVIKPNKATVFLSGNNLLNTETFKNYSISDINISQTEYKLQPRYVLLKIEYRF